MRLCGISANAVWPRCQQSVNYQLAFARSGVSADRVLPEPWSPWAVALGHVGALVGLGKAASAPAIRRRLDKPHQVQGPRSHCEIGRYAAAMHDVPTALSGDEPTHATRHKVSRAGTG